ncbi:MAG: hypothetical protein KAV87_26960 [Desulfobacteraceae bacterium]|nr:hypothetical protein [Desulfobacteraceae bacterium]
MLNAITNFISPKVGMAGLTVKNHAPEIYLAAGIAAGVGSVVMTAKAHKKSDNVFSPVTDGIDDTRAYIEQSNTEAINSGGEHIHVDADKMISASEERKMLLPFYIEGLRRAAILYGPGALMGITSVALILASHSTMRGRNKALLSTLTLFQQGFAEYRKRVVSELGEEADERFYYGGRTQNLISMAVGEDGKKKKIKGTENHIPAVPTPILYQRVFDETNRNWELDSDMNEFFLRANQTWANDRLILKGYVMLNEIYTALGFAESPEGAVVGWSGKVNGDDYISFGLENDINQREGDNRWILDFNVNGVVFETIGER